MKKNKKENKKEKRFKKINFYMCAECGFIGLEPPTDYCTDWQVFVTSQEYKYLKKEWKKFLKFQKYIKKLSRLRKVKKEKKQEYKDPEIQEKFELFKKIVKAGGGIITANPEIWEKE